MDLSLSIKAQEQIEAQLPSSSFPLFSATPTSGENVVMVKGGSQIVTPGQRLGSADEFEAGEGTDMKSTTCSLLPSLLPLLL
jgi:hypothetical protein